MADDAATGADKAQSQEAASYIACGGVSSSGGGGVQTATKIKSVALPAGKGRIVEIEEDDEEEEAELGSVLPASGGSAASSSIASAARNSIATYADVC